MKYAVLNKIILIFFVCALLAGQTKIWRQFAACVQNFIEGEESDE